MIGYQQFHECDKLYSHFFVCSINSSNLSSPFHCANLCASKQISKCVLRFFFAIYLHFNMRHWSGLHHRNEYSSLEYHFFFFREKSRKIWFFKKVIQKLYGLGWLNHWAVEGFILLSAAKLLSIFTCKHIFSCLLHAELIRFCFHYSK